MRPPTLRNKSVICRLWEGRRYTVWAAVSGLREAVLVQRHRDGAEWVFLADSKEDDLIRNLLPPCRWDARRVDLACEDAWALLGPRDDVPEAET